MPQVHDRCRKDTGSGDVAGSRDKPHIAELEAGGTITECHKSEANGKAIHPTKIDYRIKKNPDDGTWDKDKVRACVDTSRTWDSITKWCMPIRSTTVRSAPS